MLSTGWEKPVRSVRMSSAGALILRPLRSSSRSASPRPAFPSTEPEPIPLSGGEGTRARRRSVEIMSCAVRARLSSARRLAAVSCTGEVEDVRGMSVVVTCSTCGCGERGERGVGAARRKGADVSGREGATGRVLSRGLAGRAHVGAGAGAGTERSGSFSRPVPMERMILGGGAAIGCRGGEGGRLLCRKAGRGMGERGTGVAAVCAAGPCPCMLICAVICSKDGSDFLRFEDKRVVGMGRADAVSTDAFLGRRKSTCSTQARRGANPASNPPSSRPSDSKRASGETRPGEGSE